jgi:hypothetical protein
MKQYITRIALLATGLGISTHAAPFMAVGDNAELFVTAAANVQFDDNIFLDPFNQNEDLLLSFTPGVDLVFGKGSVTKGNLYVRDEIRRYKDNDNQDTELFSAGTKGSYDNGVTKADFNASYAEIAQNDNDLNAFGQIIRRDVFAVGGKIEFGISEKTSLAVGASFDQTDYDQASYSDSEIWNVPVDFYVKANPKMDWSVGYRYRNSELSGTGLDAVDHFLNVGVRGEFTPKLIGQVRAGVTQRSFDVLEDETLPGFSADLTYLFSEKTTYRFNISNDFGSSGTGDSTKIFTVGVNGTSKLSEQWSVTGGLNFRNYEYSDRTDDFLEGLVAVTYTLNSVVNFGASYTYRNNASDSALAEFQNNVFSIGTNIRY